MFESIDKYMRSHVDIDDLFESVKYKRSFRKANPTYFEPDGILVFCGPQGSGKTLSAVRYVLDLLRAFPHAILCSNVKIYGLPDSVRYVQYTGLDCFDRYNNGFEGVIFLIDEIHIEFNSLESKNMPVVIRFGILPRRLKNYLPLSSLHLRVVVLLFLLLRFHLIHLLPRMLLRL